MDDQAVEATVKYWQESSIYDLGVAESLFENKKFHYALFFGHLALEKLLKALFVKNKKEHAPRTHSLPIVASSIPLEIPSSVLEKLAEFMEFYIEGRYPRDLDTIYHKFNETLTHEKMNEVKEVHQWLIKKL